MSRSPYGSSSFPRWRNWRRLPQWADRIYVGNALEWEPPTRFDFVRTELVYVPPDRTKSYVERLFGRVVAPGGRLIVCAYGSPRSGLATDPVGEALRSLGFEPELELEAEGPEGGGAISAIACLRAA